MRRLETKGFWIALAVAAQGVVVASASANTFQVNDTTDAPRGRGGPCDCVSTYSTCTLRAAVQTANLCPGPDVIELGNGQTYLLSIGGIGEDAAATGDLDVNEDLEVHGNGSVVDAQWIDRVFDIRMGSASPVVVLEGLHLRHGRAISASGGCVRAEQAILHIVDSELDTCSAISGGSTSIFVGSGGGVFARSSDLTLTSTIVVNNLAANHGGGVYAHTTDLVIHGSTVMGCTASFGGGLAQRTSAGTVSAITDTVLFDNHGSGGGGGAYLSSVQPGVVFTGVTFHLNGTDNDGGALLIESSDVELDTSTLSHNSAGRGGGAINTEGIHTLRVRGSTVNANTAGTYGGGIYHESGQIELANSTLAGNQGGRGGAIFTRRTTELVNVTIADNTAYAAAGIYAYGIPAVVTMSSSIVARNGGSDCFAGGGASFGALRSMSSHAVCVPGPSNVVTSTPGLLALGSYGGPTQTIPLLASSPAVDGGDDPTCEPLDQRGVARPQGVQCDMGAYELAVP